MRKLVLLAMLMFCVSSFAKDDEEVKMMGIITDCGTTHRIPLGSTFEETVKWIDYYTALDCDPDDPTKLKKEVDHRSGPDNN